MVKQPPSIGRTLTMVGFALSCIGLTIFLWISFGGPIPLRPEGYRVKVPFPDAANLAQEADVRISGIDVGKVKTLEARKSPARLVATLEIDSKYAPLPRDVRAMLRQKTLLGETYVELTPGTKGAQPIDDGGELAGGSVESTVELDEIFATFDGPTREAFRRWQAELARSIREGGGEDLSDGFGNLPGVAENGAAVLEVLDRRGEALERLVRNTGIVFRALNQQEGGIRDLIVNSNRLFETTASRNESIAQIVEIFPTFLDESRATVSRLERFSVDTRPLVRDLTPVARDLGPTVRDLGDLAPDLEDLFGDLRVLNATAPDTVPDGRRFIAGAEEIFGPLHVFLQELNPILSFANFQAPQLADFLTTGAAALAYSLPPRGPNEGPRHFLRQFGLITGRSVALNQTLPPYDRGNAYLEPNAQLRRRAAGVLESFDCPGGEQPQPREGLPPCLVEPPSLWGREHFPNIDRGEAPVVPPPRENDGTEPPGP